MWIESGSIREPAHSSLLRWNVHKKFIHVCRVVSISNFMYNTMVNPESSHVRMGWISVISVDFSVISVDSSVISVDSKWFQLIPVWFQISLLWNHTAVWFQISLLWNHTAVWFQISPLWNHTLNMESNWNHPESTEITLNQLKSTWNHPESTEIMLNQTEIKPNDSGF